MKIDTRPLGLLAVLFFSIFPARAQTQNFSDVVVWTEAGVPSADGSVASREELSKAFVGARFTPTDQLATQLADVNVRLLVLPQGSVVPEVGWPVIESYLRRGGNLLVLGGRPFTRAAYHDDKGWHLRDYSVRFTRPLLIDQYQPTPGSVGEEFTPNKDVALDLPKFSWQQAYSPVIRLSTSDLYKRGGTAGTLDVRLDTLVWGVKNGRRLSAPLMEIDHSSSGFDGGRWIFLTADMPANFFGTPDAAKLLSQLAERARVGAEEFTVKPTLALYLPGEPIELEAVYSARTAATAPLTVQVSEFPEGEPSSAQKATISLPATTLALIPAPAKKGLHIVEARLMEGTKLSAIYHSAFWIRDEAFLRSGPKMTVNADYFEIDGKTLAVVGTTYMSSDVQRLYFDHPNVYVWSEDLKLIHDAGLNMVRSGWWTGWDKLCDENGRPYERTLRTMEAYLMTARKYGLPVQFNFFAFLPDVLGGANPYLDPQAVSRQQRLIGSVTARFHDVPYVAWDLINEPSFSKYLWRMRPNEDAIELTAWNQWLNKRYPDRAALAHAWNLPADAVQGIVSLPSEMEFTPRGMYVGKNSLRVYDFTLFAQEQFANWVRGMREVIRGNGANQPITVGQDEGGYMDRLSPAYFAPYVDFTTNHSWWQNDYLLWDSVVAKQPGVAMLIQETGLQRELNLDEVARRTEDQEARLFERKSAMAFVQGSGSIEWLWNANSYMTESNETPIGALHPDGTEKAEATVLREMAKFSVKASPYLKQPKLPAVAVITSQAAQFSVQGDLQLLAQQGAVRALGYEVHQPFYVVAENQIEKLGTPTLAILPSAQALRESTWQALLKYAQGGGNLLVTGSVSRDEHWHLVDRLTPLHLTGTTEPMTQHNAAISFDPPPGKLGKSADINVAFEQSRQQLLEFVRFENGATVQVANSGKGKVFWVSYPVELGEGAEATAAVYSGVLGRIGIAQPFTLASNAPKGTLIFPIELKDAVLYVLESEAAQDSDIQWKDGVTGANLTVRLPAQRAVVLIVEKATKKIVAQYGF
jgi:Beta-galactosidase